MFSLKFNQFRFTFKIRIFLTYFLQRDEDSWDVDFLLWCVCTQMKWADRAQKVVNVARKGKDFVLGRSGLIFAIIILIIAVLLHWLGVIGSWHSLIGTVSNSDHKKSILLISYIIMRANELSYSSFICWCCFSVMTDACSYSFSHFSLIPDQEESMGSNSQIYNPLGKYSIDRPT